MWFQDARVSLLGKNAQSLLGAGVEQNVILRTSSTAISVGQFSKYEDAYQVMK